VPGAPSPYGGPVRIGMICPYSLTIPGGVQGQVLGLARMVRAAGHEVRVLGPCDGPPPDVGITPVGATLPVAGNGSIAPIAPDVPAQLRTLRVLRDEAFDVLHLHEPLIPGPTQTALLFKPAPLVGTFHAAGSVGGYRVLRPLLRAGARRLDLRCAVSPDAEALARDAVGGTYEPVFNGVDVDQFAKATPWATDAPTIFFLGRHEPRKGLGVLLAAMAELPAGVRLWIGGEGPHTEELRAEAAGDVRIEWLGRISDAEKAARLRGAEVFCAPSLSGESFGVVLLEAMAAEACIVASELPGYAAVARSGVDALLVPPGDASALAGALRRALGDADLRRRLVASGERRAAAYGLDKLADRYLGFYQRLLRRGHEQG
jgi:phosphatidylinositol alpha-mannosyltransferase